MNLDIYMIPSLEASGTAGINFFEIVSWLLKNDHVLTDQRASNKLYQTLRGTNSQTIRAIDRSGKMFAPQSGSDQIVALYDLNKNTLRYIIEDPNGIIKPRNSNIASIIKKIKK